MKVFERKARGEKRWSNSPLTVLEVGQLSKTEVDRGDEIDPETPQWGRNQHGNTHTYARDTYG